MFDTIIVYEQDRDLIKKLGLTNWDGFPSHKLHDVGTVRFEGVGSVQVFVEGMPGLFFKFIILDQEGGFRYQASTGSGSFSDFWPTAEKLATNMFVIKNQERLPSEESV